MLTDEYDDTRQARLQAIADLLGVRPEAICKPFTRDGTVEMLSLWLTLPGLVEQRAALAYLRLLACGNPT